MSKAHTQSRTEQHAGAGHGVVPSVVEATNWREALPVLTTPLVTLREVVRDDALALLTALPEGALDLIVTDPPVATAGGYESLVERLHNARRAGTMATWAIVPTDGGAAIGLIGFKTLDHGGTIMEGAAVLAEEFRGTGLFQSAARLALTCAFERMRVHRVEFRIDVRNGRANGALRKLGAQQEGVLRRARFTESEVHDQVLWAMLASDWAGTTPRASGSIH